MNQPHINSGHRNSIGFVQTTLWGVFFLSYLAIESVAHAQVIPDESLGSRVTEGNGLFLIQEGTQRGSDLFHSFSSFSIPVGSTARFLNGTEIENIFSRVTGNQRSTIEGVIEAEGNANLFLLNPQGFLFGQSAQIRLGGSFLVTSADALRFSEGSVFSATSIASPPLLSLGVPVGLQYGSAPGQIVVLGLGGSNGLAYSNTLSSLDRSNSQPTLAVQPGQRITLLGGEVILIGGSLAASGGLSLGSVGAGESVALNDGGLRPSYGGVNNFQDITIDQASVDSSGANAGPIELAGQSIRLQTRAVLLSQNESTAPTGSITVRATDTVELTGPNLGNIPSTISTGPRLGSGGTAGPITIQARQLLMRDGAIIEARPFGNNATGGDVSIETRETIALSGAGSNGRPSLISTELPDRFPATAGNIRLKTARLSLQDGAIIQASSDGVGNAGNIDIEASESVRIVGQTPRGASGLIFTGLNPEGTNPEAVIGNAGNINVVTPTLLIADGGTLNAGSRGQGDAGRISITGAQDVVLEGNSRSGLGSSISSTVFVRGAKGNAGSIFIETERLSLRDGGRLLAASFAEGGGGDIQIQAREGITLEGSDRRRGSSSNIVTGITADAVGDSGQLRIQTGDLTLKDGGRLVSLTFGQGDAGDIDVEATGRILLEGASDGGFPANISASVAGPSAIGQGGNITLEARELTLRDNAFITAETASLGSAGNVRINTTRSIVLEGGSQISSENDAGQGTAGNVSLTTQALTLDNESEARVSATGSFDAGSLSVDAKTVQLLRGSRLFGETEAGDRANIDVRAQLLRIGPTASITTNATGTSTGGDINLDTDLLLIQNGGQVLAQAISNRGGNIQIETEGLFQEAGSIIDASSQLGIDGVISINRPEVDPSQNKTELPSQVTDVDQLIARSCLRRGPSQQGQFLITGRGGLPRLPGDAVMASFDIYQHAPETSAPEGTPPETDDTTTWIQEATTFQRLADGRVVLAERSCA